MDACEREKKKKRYTPETLDWTQMDTQMAANYLCGSSLIVGEMSDCLSWPWETFCQNVFARFAIHKKNQDIYPFSRRPMFKLDCNA